MRKQGGERQLRRLPKLPEVPETRTPRPAFRVPIHNTGLAKQGHKRHLPGPVETNGEQKPLFFVPRLVKQPAKREQAVHDICSRIGIDNKENKPQNLRIGLQGDDNLAARKNEHRVRQQDSENS